MIIQNKDVRVGELITQKPNAKTGEPYQVWLIYYAGECLELTYHPNIEKVEIKTGQILNCSLDINFRRIKKQKQTGEIYFTSTYYGSFYNVFIKYGPQFTPTKRAEAVMEAMKPQEPQITFNQAFTSGSKTEMKQAYENPIPTAQEPEINDELPDWMNDLEADMKGEN